MVGISLDPKRMEALQKANLALSYTVAVRDKVLDAYKEIMNMSI